MNYELNRNMRIIFNGLLTVAFVFTGLVYAGCGQSDSGSASSAITANNTEENDGGLSADELIKGIGPIKSVTLTEIDASLAEKGEQVFTIKCSACHKMNERYVGPPLGGITDRRAPEYVMNMMLNPDQMVREHPEAKKMLATYMTPMPNQNLTEEDARAVLEYLRTQKAESN